MKGMPGAKKYSGGKMGRAKKAAKRINKRVNKKLRSATKGRKSRR